MSSLHFKMALCFVFVTCFGGKMSYVPVDSQGSGVTRKDAIADALQDAVSQVNGAEIAAEMSSSIKEKSSEKNGKDEYSSEESFLPQQAIHLNLDTEGIEYESLKWTFFVFWGRVKKTEFFFCDGICIS